MSVGRAVAVLTACYVCPRCDERHVFYSGVGAALGPEVEHTCGCGAVNLVECPVEVSAVLPFSPLTLGMLNERVRDAGMKVALAASAIFDPDKTWASDDHLLRLRVAEFEELFAAAGARIA